MDKALTKADSALIPQEFNGLYAQHAQNDAFASLDAYLASETIVDCRGATLSEANIEKAAEGIVENFGVGTDTGFTTFTSFGATSTLGVLTGTLSFLNTSDIVTVLFGFLAFFIYITTYRINPRMSQYSSNGLGTWNESHP